MKWMNHFSSVSFFALLSFFVQAQASELEVSDSQLNLSEPIEFTVPVVLTATRLKQQQVDVPASVTILDDAFIQQLGVRNLAELFHYVPGMIVAPDHNNNADAVHYHGGPATLPKSLQVLVNGRSMYHSGLAAVSWYEIPVALEDIKRIEIVRGPNAASYGANAYQGVINILTKHPADTYGSTVRTQLGNNSDHYVYAKQGGRFGETDYRLSYVEKKTAHFKDIVSDVIGCDSPCGDDRASRFIDVETHRQLDGGREVELSFVVQDSEKEIGNPISLQVGQNRLSESRYELGLRFTQDLSSKHQLKLSTYATQLNQRQVFKVAGVPVAFLDADLQQLYVLNPDAAKQMAGFQLPSALDITDDQQVWLFNRIQNRYPDIASAITPVSGSVHADLDEYRFDIELQDTYIVSPELSLVSGISYRRDKINSEHYFKGEEINDTRRLFAAATWKPLLGTSFHLGLMAEKESDMGTVYAPRAAVNYKFTPNQSVRLVYSESVRSPDLFEQNANWNFKLSHPQPAEAIKNGDTFYQTWQGPGNLNHECITSYEVGYNGHALALNTQWDVKVFKEALSHVVYQKIDLATFTLYQGNRVTFEGVEWQLQTQPSRNATFRIAGAHVEADYQLMAGLSPAALLQAYAKDTLALSWLHRWGPALGSHLSYLTAHKFAQDTIRQQESTAMKRVNVYVYRDFDLGGVDSQLALSAQHDLDDTYFDSDTRVQLGLMINF
ncbi:MAG: iron complex outermembrane receptor protein [Oceanicoccus sp.]|jgi:iron complex outermembrane receptor protein